MAITRVPGEWIYFGFQHACSGLLVPLGYHVGDRPAWKKADGSEENACAKLSAAHGNLSVSGNPDLWNLENSGMAIISSAHC